MKRLRVAVLGFGRVGSACCGAIRASDDLDLAGIVRRPESVGSHLPDAFRDVPVVIHVNELREVGAALLCLPPDQVREAAHHLLQHRIPVVECATLHGDDFRTHVAAIDRVAQHHRTPAVLGAGWDPGVLSLLRGLFALLTPKGHTQTRYSPGVNLHHTLTARDVRGVKDALCADVRGPEGNTQRYVYVELEPGADADRVAAAIRADPLCADQQVVVLPVESVAALEQEGHGIVLDRWGTSGAAAHQRFLLEARFDTFTLAAQVMLAAARAVSVQPPGAHSLFHIPLATLWGDLALRAVQDVM